MNILEARKFINTCVRIDPKCNGNNAWNRGWLVGVDRTDGIVKPKGHKHEIHIDLKYLQPWKKGVSMNDPEKAERLFSDINKKDDKMIKHYVVRYLSSVTGNYFYFTNDNKFMEVPPYKFKMMLNVSDSCINFYDDINNSTRAAKKILNAKSRNLTKVEVLCVEDNCIINEFEKPTYAKPFEDQEDAPKTVENIISEVKIDKDLNQLLELYVTQRRAVLLAKEMEHEEKLKLLKIEADIDIAVMTNKLLNK